MSSLRNAALEKPPARQSQGGSRKFFAPRSRRGEEADPLPANLRDRPTPSVAEPVTSGELSFDERCGNARVFNNRTSAGKLIPAYNRDTGHDQSEIANMIEDALLLSL